MKTKETVRIEDLLYDVEQIKPFKDKRLAWHYYVSRNGKDYLTTKIGTNTFSKPTPLPTKQ